MFVLKPILLSFVLLTLGRQDNSFLGSAQELYSDDELIAMTDEELEQICVSRGFEIARDQVDPATGLPYEIGHEDFVEAAKTCISIEQEMYD